MHGSLKGKRFSRIYVSLAPAGPYSAKLKDKFTTVLAVPMLGLCLLGISEVSVQKEG